MAPWERTYEELDYVDRMCQKELDANRHLIPQEHLKEGIERHLYYIGETGLAFEYLYLEIMKREYEGIKRTIGKEKAMEIALMLDLDNQEEVYCPHFHTNRPDLFCRSVRSFQGHDT